VADAFHKTPIDHRLTLPPETIPSCYRRNGMKFQPHSGRTAMGQVIQMIKPDPGFHGLISTRTNGVNCDAGAGVPIILCAPVALP